MSIANFNPQPRIETRSMYQFTAGRPECRPADELVYREDDPSSSLYYIEVGRSGYTACCWTDVATPDLFTAQANGSDSRAVSGGLHLPRRSAICT